MKKLFLILAGLFILWPAATVSQSYNLTIRMDYDQDKKYYPGDVVPVQIRVTGNVIDVEQVRLIMMSVEDNRSGKDVYRVPQGEIRPTAQDYGNGYIIGTIDYETYVDDTGIGEHKIKVFLCNTSNREQCINSQWAQIKVEVVGTVLISEGDPGDGDGDADADGDGDSDGDGDDDGDGERQDLFPPGSNRFNSIWDFLVYVVRILLSAAGIVATGALIIGGYQYMTSSGIPDRVEVAKATITYAILGLVIIILAFVATDFIFRQLNVDTNIIWFIH